MLDNVNARPVHRTALGQILENEQQADYAGGYSEPGIQDVPYEVVNTATATPTQSAPLVVQTMTATGGSMPLPTFNFNTSEASCTDCNATSTVPTTLPATTSSATATSTVPVKVTPMPEAAPTTNWLLIGAIFGFGVLMYKSSTSTSTLGNAPEPTPAPKTLGRPPRRPEPKATRHVKELTIS